VPSDFFGTVSVVNVKVYDGDSHALALLDGVQRTYEWRKIKG
jgi:hypothetical protein